MISKNIRRTFLASATALALAAPYAPDVSGILVANEAQAQGAGTGTGTGGQGGAVGAAGTGGEGVGSDQPRWPQAPDAPQGGITMQ